jgi:hypothetical protein
VRAHRADAISWAPGNSDDGRPRTNRCGPARPAPPLTRALSQAAASTHKRDEGGEAAPRSASPRANEPPFRALREILRQIPQLENTLAQVAAAAAAALVPPRWRRGGRLTQGEAVRRRRRALWRP